MDWLRGQNTAAKITTTITAAIAYKKRLSPKKSIATSRIWHPYATGVAWSRSRTWTAGHQLVTSHMRGSKRSMILLKPSGTVWPADVACEHADLAQQFPHGDRSQAREPQNVRSAQESDE